MSRLIKILAALLLVLLLVVLVITFGGGPYIRSYIDQHGTELLGRRVCADGVHLNGFTGSLKIDSLFVAEKDGTTRFLSVRRAQTRLNLPRLLFGVIKLDELELEGVRLDVLQRDTVFNFSDILEHIFIDQADQEPLPLVIKDIRIHNSYIHYKDSLVGSEFNLNDFSLFVPGIDFRDINTSVGINLSFTDGGSLQTRFDYDDRNKAYQLDLNITGLNLRSILPYVRQKIWLGDLQGVANLDLEMRGSTAHLLDFTLRGYAGIRSLDVLDEAGTTMVRCDTVNITVRDMDVPANRIYLSRVHFERPYIHIQYDKDSLDNFNRLIQKAERILYEQDSMRLVARLEAEGITLPPDQPLSELLSDSTEQQDESPLVEFNGRARDLHLLIDSLLIDSARLTYRDESLPYMPFVYELSSVNIAAPNFTLNGVNHITADAQLGREGRLRFWYDGRTMDGSNLHMVVQADHIDVKDFSPYTLQMFGNEVSRGTMSVNLMYDTKNGRMLGQNHIVVRDPKVEKKRRNVDSEMNIPFRTGVYILTDKNNVLDIDLPVKGNIEDPKFSYKRLLFRTMGKFLVKVVSSPFRRNHNRSAGADILVHDTRSLDDIDLDSISSDLLQDE